MKKIKRYYYYFYYKWYRLIGYTSEELGGKFLTDFKAGIAITALGIWFVTSLFNYCIVFVDRDVNFSKSNYLITGISIAILNSILIYQTDIRKVYFKDFDQLPKEKQKKGSWIVFGISLFIILNLIFSFFLVYNLKRH